MRSCLIVDASAETRSGIAESIRAAQKGVMFVHEASDPASALRLFDAERPDVVFLDMALAGEGAPAGGLGLVRAMLDLRPHLPIVVVTGPAQAQPDVVEAIGMGALAALRRPVRPEDVKYVLDAIEPEKARMDYFS